MLYTTCLRWRSRVQHKLARCLHGLAAPSSVDGLAASGLFGLSDLVQPSHWSLLAARAVERCDALVHEALLHERPADVVQAIDDISDVICQTYDAAEFCRNVHADPAWRAAAQQTCVDLGGYIGKLNTHQGLYRALLRALEKDDAHHTQHAQRTERSSTSHTTEISTHKTKTPVHATDDSDQMYTREGGLSQEGRLVGLMLKRDFEKHGIHLPEETRAQLVALTVATSQVGMQIGANMIDPSALGTLTLTPTHYTLASTLLHDPSSVLSPPPPPHHPHPTLITTTAACGQLLTCADDVDLRAQVYAAVGSTPSVNEALVQQLVDLRRATAGVLGVRSYSASQTEGFSLAGRPEAAEGFLLQLLDALQEQAQEEVNELAAVKAQLTGVVNEKVAPWDRQYLMAVKRSTVCDVGSAAVVQYFSLDACLTGLDMLLQQLMGVTLTKVPFARGEAWADGVVKLAVNHEEEGLLGHIYLDLHARPGKCTGAAHFTLRSGRCLRGSGRYQTPLVALVCNFSRGTPFSGWRTGGGGSGGGNRGYGTGHTGTQHTGTQHAGTQHAGTQQQQQQQQRKSNSGNARVLLSHGEVQTLYHEFGHALHSLLSRTEFQHLAGTRGAMDMVEVPSHWMERFASDPQCLAMWARHASTGDPIPHAMAARIQQVDRMFYALNTQHQALLALVDLRLHGADPLPSGGVTQLVRDVFAEHASIPPPPNHKLQLRFGHLVGYGGGYYAYLYAHALARGIWRRHHQDGAAYTRQAGERVRRHLLQPGGARWPHDVIVGLQGEGALQKVEGGWAPALHDAVSA